MEINLSASFNAIKNEEYGTDAREGEEKEKQDLGLIMYGARKKEFACLECPYNTDIKFNMTKHVRVMHTNKLRFMCKQCGERFPQQENLTEHVKESHDSEFSCSYCGIGYVLKKRLQTHIMKEHVLERLSCPYCVATFRKNHLLRRHVRHVHLRTRVFACQVCGLEFCEQSRLKTHMVTHERAVYPCPGCPMKFLSSERLEQHSKKHLKDGKSECVLCKVRLGEKEMESHLVEEHGLDPLVCSKCRKRFREQTELEKHIQQAHKVGEARFPCPICEEGFRQLGPLTAHLRLMHPLPL